MNKQIIIRFFEGTATEEEVNALYEWVNSSDENKNYFIELKTVWSLSKSTLSPEMVQESKDFIANGIKPNFNAKKTSPNYKRIATICAAAAVVALFFAVGALLINPKSLPTVGEELLAEDTSAEREIPVYTLYTNKGVKGSIVLPDGSKVWLNSDTKLSFPTKFDPNRRDVKLSGEAYFEVVKDSLRPMIITTNKNFSVEVLGTTFNIKSYDNDNTAQTTLYNGSIRMHYKNKANKQAQTIDLKPDESFVYYDENYRPKQLKPKKPEEHKAWVEGELIFNNTPMEEVIKMLERWHGTAFDVQNSAVYRYSLTATFSSESIIQILDMMQYIMPIKYEYNNNIVRLL